MTVSISRRKLAQYAASMILSGHTEQVMQQIAAYLVLEHRTREANLVVRDIEAELASRGVVLATVTTAHALTTELRMAIESMLDAEHVYITEVIDPSVIGGVRVDMPGRQYDATVRRKLELLKELTLV